MADLTETFALTSLPEVNLYNPDGPDTTPAETAQALTQWERDWHEDGIGYYTARLRETGTYVGYMGLRKRTADNTSYLNLAYRIHPAMQGKGLVWEGCTAILEAARKQFAGMQVRALTKQQNKQSIAAALRLGLQHIPALDNRPDPDDINFGMLL